jgi:hypothetical protein
VEQACELHALQPLLEPAITRDPPVLLWLIAAKREITRRVAGSWHDGQSMGASAWLKGRSASKVVRQSAQ